MSLIVQDVVGLVLMQDQGRSGFYDIGVTVGGAMDMEAHNMANSLLGNKDQAATVELSLASVKFQVTKLMQLCVCGAESTLTVNGQAQALWQTFIAKAEDIVEINAPKTGCRSYLAVAGGFDTPIFFGSRSTVLREKLGGFDGQLLKRNDELPVCSNAHSTSYPLQNRRYHQSDVPKYGTGLTLRIVLGYQHQAFSEVQKRLFFSSEYEVSQQSDRMGYRLKGQTVKCDDYALISEGICLGAVQIPADGQPIILMRDRQTIGGYPKMGAVLSVDVNKLSQAIPGCKINFQAITVEDAHNALHLHAAKLNRRFQNIESVYPSDNN